MSTLSVGATFEEVRRRLALLTPGERLRWLTFFPLGVITAVLETVGGVIVFALLAALTNPAGAPSGAMGAAITTWLSRNGLGVTPLALTLVAAGMYVVKNSALLAALYYRARVSCEIATRLTERVARAYIAAPYVFHLRRNSADVSQSVLYGVPAVVRILDSGVTLITEVLVVSGLVLLLMRIAVIETLIATAIIGGIVGVFVRATRGRYHRLGARHFELSQSVLRTLQQALGGIKEVKVFGREQYFGDVLVRDEAARTRIAVQHDALENVPRLLTETAFVLGMLGLVLTLEFRTGSSGAVLPFIGLYAYAGFRMIPAGHRIAVQAGSIRYHLATSAVLCEDMDALGARLPRARAAVPASGGVAARTSFTDRLRLENVSYAYDAGAPAILRQIDLEVPWGECVALVGATGAGKTTLVDLVLGLLDPLTGRITVDGAPIAERLRGWQAQIGYVPQDPVLVDDTLRRNIAFGIGDADIDDAAVMAAARVAQLEEFIGSLPAGLDTVVGERGVRLSGGERQRVSIARALYLDPALLVFDEATSSLDPGTEQALTRAIDGLKGQKTLLVIAHRMSTVEHADRIVVLRDGRIEASGTYAELAQSSQAFRALAALSE